MNAVSLFWRSWSESFWDPYLSNKQHFDLIDAPHINVSESKNATAASESTTHGTRTSIPESGNHAELDWSESHRSEMQQSLVRSKRNAADSTTEADDSNHKTSDSSESSTGGSESTTGGHESTSESGKGAELDSGESHRSEVQSIVRSQQDAANVTTETDDSDCETDDDDDDSESSTSGSKSTSDFGKNAELDSNESHRSKVQPVARSKRDAASSTTEANGLDDVTTSETRSTESIDGNDASESTTDHGKWSTDGSTSSTDKEALDSSESNRLEVRQVERSKRNAENVTAQPNDSDCPDSKKTNNRALNSLIDHFMKLAGFKSIEKMLACDHMKEGVQTTLPPPTDQPEVNSASTTNIAKEAQKQRKRRSINFLKEKLDDTSLVQLSRKRHRRHAHDEKHDNYEKKRYHR